MKTETKKQNKLDAIDLLAAKQGNYTMIATRPAREGGSPVTITKSIPLRFRVSK